MPSRVFSALDAVTDAFTVTGIYRDGDGNTELPLSDILLQTGVGSWSLTLNLSSANDLPTRATAECVLFSIDPTVLVQEWTVDYTNFPAVPANAKIKKLVFNRPRSVNYAYNGAASDMVRAAFQMTSDAGLITPIYFTNFVDEPWISPVNFAESYAGIPADEVIFDHEGTEDFVTRDELIASYSQFNNNFSGINIQANVDDVTNPANCSLAGSLVFGLGWTVTVTWEEEYRWTVSQNEQVEPGDTVVLNSPDDGEQPEAVDFEEVTQIDVVFPDPDNPGDFITINVPEVDWLTVTTNQLLFLFPDLGVYEPTVVQIVLTSNQFTGTVSKQMYTIYFVSASGIYQLVPGKTSDTLYIEDQPGETIDVKIPNPHGITGFFAK